MLVFTGEKVNVEVKMFGEDVGAVRSKYNQYKKINGELVKIGSFYEYKRRFICRN